ncbi:hypothetical protein ANCCAN_20481 [Ancylostoma caninum]|uniref:Uncharacterized protein n=1 Tax=Ancylostoma caninum TaxID=29170 RepID=A0A368FNA0_ANCCA|nr:hypothetical protein ANCCAN_20481 [Ancylostoma caninum]
MRCLVFMSCHIYEPPYLPVISVVYKVVGATGSAVNVGGVVISLLSDTRKMRAFSRFILNVQVSNTVSLVYITILSCPFFVPSLGLTYNGILTYNFDVSPYTQTVRMSQKFPFFCTFIVSTAKFFL